jgi:hypothetical protein
MFNGISPKNITIGISPYIYPPYIYILLGGAILKNMSQWEG